MKLQQTIIEKTFHVKVGEKVYCVSYLNSDKHTLGLANRYIWEVYDEDGEEVPLNSFKSMSKEEVKKNHQLVDKLIKFCVKHF